MSATLRLSTFQAPIFPTIQGDGILVGTPMVFLRLHGCDFHCGYASSACDVRDPSHSFACDTIDTWRPGSPWVDMRVDDVIAEIYKHSHAKHIAITGGNPVLQGDAVLELIERLPQHRTLIETQGSVAHACMEECSLLSLSPKLHDYREEVWAPIVRKRLFNRLPTQIKVVVKDRHTADLALSNMAFLRRWFEGVLEEQGYNDLAIEQTLSSLHLILLPAFEAGRAGVAASIAAIKDYHQARMPEQRHIDFRVIPQVHKLALFVP